jgi:hypothetical protein
MSKITNTGELRAFLCSAINNVANGTFDVHKAKEVTKIAAQVNESLYAEVKVARTQLELGREVAKFGALHLGEAEIQES